MAKRGKVQEVRKHHFAFLGLLKCASCGCSITGERQKGHNYYRCTKKKGLCQEKHYLREEALTEQIKSFLQKVSLSSQDKPFVSKSVIFSVSATFWEINCPFLAAYSSVDKASAR